MYASQSSTNLLFSHIYFLENIINPVPPLEEYVSKEDEFSIVVVSNLRRLKNIEFAIMLANCFAKRKKLILDIYYAHFEEKYLEEIKDGIDSTYSSHYAQNKVQSTEFIADAGNGEGFCIGNIIKYAQRYGKKNGYNREDLKKIVHYAIIMMHIHDTIEHKEDDENDKKKKKVPTLVDGIYYDL